MMYLHAAAAAADGHTIILDHHKCFEKLEFEYEKQTDSSKLTCMLLDIKAFANLADDLSDLSETALDLGRS